jgi:hypothetical protein
MFDLTEEKSSQFGEEASVDLPGGMTFGGARPAAGTAVGTISNASLALLRRKMMLMIKM